MRHRLKRWWNIAPLWPVLLSILFGMDVAKIDIDRPLDLFHLIEAFYNNGKAVVAYPEVFHVISGMLKAGVGVIVMDQGQKKAQEQSPEEKLLSVKNRRRSMSLNGETLPQGSIHV